MHKWKQLQSSALWPLHGRTLEQKPATFKRFESTKCDADAFSARANICIAVPLNAAGDCTSLSRNSTHI